MNRVSAACVAVLLGACVPKASGGAGTVVSPEGMVADPQWSEGEMARPSALRNLRRTPEASFHLLRVTGEPPATVSENSDLVVMVVSGILRIELGTQTLEVKRGDVVEVPRGTPVKMRNMGTDAGAAYLVYTPALAPDDYRTIAEKRRDSSWKWNLWPQ
jgi:mannose-6-phosphate isomerase-like protein (cupin superfamily)